MTTLHRKPRGVFEQSASSTSNGGALSETSYYTTIDILPSSSAREATSVHSASISINGSHQSSKTRRHGGGKYVRRSGFFGRGNGSPSGSSSSSSSAASKKMSTTQLRAFFAACVLVYLSALCFAEDIVKFGKAVNSDATRQKIFSQWRPMHSAAKQVLRSIVDSANGNGDGAAVVVANATEPLPAPETAALETAATEMEEKSGSPEPSMNSEREPPTAAVLTAPPPVEEQVAPLSEEPHVALSHQEPSLEPDAEANRPVEKEEKRSDPLPHVENESSKQLLSNAVPNVESKEEAPQHVPVIADNDQFDPAQMEDRIEDSAVVDEHQETPKSSNVDEVNGVQPEQEHRSSAAPVAPSIFNADGDAETEHPRLPEATPTADSPVEATTAAAVPVAVAEQPTAAAAKEDLVPTAVNPASPPVGENPAGAAKEDAREPASLAPVEEPQAKAEEKEVEIAAKTEEPTPESRHPGREET